MTDPAAPERMEMWSDVYMKVMDQAPWVPVFNEQRYTMKSARMGGADSLYVDPVSIPTVARDVYDVTGAGDMMLAGLAAARALIDQKNLSAEDIAKKSLNIAADICVYTNNNLVIETL